MTTRYHAGNGLFASRLMDGQVCLELHETPNPESRVVKCLFLLPSAWASVVAHVSGCGETLESHAAALLFHQTPPREPALREPESDEPTLVEGLRA